MQVLTLLDAMNLAQYKEHFQQEQVKNSHLWCACAGMLACMCVCVYVCRMQTLAHKQFSSVVRT